MYEVSLPDLTLTPVSSADQMSVEAHWSPDGKSIVYQDFTGSDSPLAAVDVQTGKVTKLTNPKQDGPDFWPDWR